MIIPTIFTGLLRQRVGRQCFFWNGYWSKPSQGGTLHTRFSYILIQMHHPTWLIIFVYICILCMSQTLRNRSPFWLPILVAHFQGESEWSKGWNRHGRLQLQIASTAALGALAEAGRDAIDVFFGNGVNKWEDHGQMNWPFWDSPFPKTVAYAMESKAFELPRQVGLWQLALHFLTELADLKLANEVSPLSEGQES